MSELGPSIEHYPGLDKEYTDLCVHNPGIDYACSAADLEELLFAQSSAYEVTAHELRIGDEFADCSTNRDIVTQASRMPSVSAEIRKNELSMKVKSARAFEYLDDHPEVRNLSDKIKGYERYLRSADGSTDITAKGKLRELQEIRNRYHLLRNEVEEAARGIQKAQGIAIDGARRALQIHQSAAHATYGAEPDCCDQPSDLA